VNRSTRKAAIVVSLFACLLAIVREGRTDDVETRVGIPITKLERQDAVSFVREILPILNASCIPCHNQVDANADLALDTVEAIRKGGNGGAVIVPGESGRSRLLSLAAHRGKRPMPPPDNKIGAKALSPDQLGLVRLWIDQGARGSSESRPSTIVWQSPAATLQPVLALSIARDDRHVAFSRAGRLFVYDLMAGKIAARLVDPELLGGQAHADLIRSMAFSPDGNLLATGGFRTIKIWSRPRTMRTASITLDANPKFVAIRRDGQTAAFALADGRISVYDLNSGTLTRELNLGNRDAVSPRGIAFSADGSNIYAAFSDDVIRCWKAETGSSLGAFHAPSPIHSLATDGAGGPISGHADGQILSWDLTKITDANAPQTKPRIAIKAHAKPVTSLVTCSANPSEMISASEDGWLRRWSTADGRMVSEFHHGGPIAAIAARPDVSRLVSVGGRVARLWDTSTGAVVAEIKGDHRTRDNVRKADGQVGFANLAVELRKQDLRAVEGRIETLTKGIDEAAKQVLVAEKALEQVRETARKPRAEKLAAQVALQAADDSLALTIMGRKAASQALGSAGLAEVAAQEIATRTRSAAAIDPRGADLARAAEKRTTEATAIKRGAEMAIKAADEAIQVADRARGAAVNANYQALERALSADNQVKDAETAVESAKFSLNTTGKVLDRDRPLLGRAKGAITVAEALAAQRKAARTSAEATATASEKDWLSAAFSADGSRLMLGGDDRGLHIFDADRGHATEVLDTSQGPIRTLAAAAESRLVTLSSTTEATVSRLAGAWTLVRQIGRADDSATLSDRVMGLDFHPDGKRLASAGGEAGRTGELKIWDIHDGHLLRELPTAHRDAIFGVRFSNSGHAIATASADRSVRVIAADGNGPSLILTGHANHVRGVAWSADDKVLASCGADNVVKLWNAEDGSLIRTHTGDVNRTRDYRREVSSIAFVGESDMILTASGDKTVRVQSAANPHYMRVYEGMRSFAYAAAATTDGKVVVAGGHDGSLRIWNAENANVIGECSPATKAVPLGRMPTSDVK
jgi:WD40 repeat protein